MLGSYTFVSVPFTLSLTSKRRKWARVLQNIIKLENRCLTVLLWLLNIWARLSVVTMNVSVFLFMSLIRERKINALWCKDKQTKWAHQKNWLNLRKLIWTSSCVPISKLYIPMFLSWSGRYTSIREFVSFWFLKNDLISALESCLEKRKWMKRLRLFTKTGGVLGRFRLIQGALLSALISTTSWWG